MTDVHHQSEQARKTSLTNNYNQNNVANQLIQTNFNQRLPTIADRNVTGGGCDSPSFAEFRFSSK